jgi:ribonuclease HI
MSASSPLQVWVDGSCSNNQNQPAFDLENKLAKPKARSAAYFPALRKGISRDLPGEQQTNIRAEIDAVLLVFEELEKSPPQELEIFTDCLNVLKWAQKQQKANKNLDLIHQLWARIESWPAKITFRHVKGHSGDPNNEMVDKLATGKLPNFG